MKRLGDLAATLMAAAPVELGGVWLRGPEGPERSEWLTALRNRLGPSIPWVPMPIGIDQDRLDGGLDLAATLQAGRRVEMPGLIARARGGILVVNRPDRLDAGAIGSLVRALDGRLVAVVLLDETAEPDPPVPPGLTDRAGLIVDLTAPETDELVDDGHAPAPSVEESLGILCRVAARCGIGSLRPPLFAIRAARALAAAAGRTTLTPTDLAWAARLVLGPRATGALDPPASTPTEPSASPPQAAPTPDRASGSGASQLEDRVVDAVKTALPANVLDRLVSTARGIRGSARGGPVRHAPRSGRTVGHRPGDPRRHRLHWYATAVAAAPWQRLRIRTRPPRGDQAPPRLILHRDDLRIRRLVKPGTTTTVFVVDASGSAALHRLGEAKGAVELLLAQSYLRRDQVALIAFGGSSARVVLPPTRSLTRARRVLTALPGGGGTPLGCGLALGERLASQVARSGSGPLLVVLTDGRANVADDGQPGRARAEADALAASRAIARAGWATLVVDVAPRPNPAVARLAEAMAGRYLPLPYLDRARLQAEASAAAAEVRL